MVLEQEKRVAPPPPKKPTQAAKQPSKKGWVALLILLLLIIGAETAIIVAQSQANKRIEAQSQQALGKFLKSGQQVATGKGTELLMQNVRFCWSKQVCINTARLTAQAVPTGGQSAVNFDNLNGFMVNVHNATVQISPQTLQGMFNESVFNYPNSTLRDLTVGIEPVGGQNHVKLNGSLKYLFLWIPFEMDTNLSVDRKTNTLVIAVNTLKVFGIIPATWLIEFKPFNLEKLLTLPPNNYLTVRKNLMMVKPFGLFPPPRINGTMASISVMPKLISLRFTGSDQAFQPLPDASAKNFIYLQGGSTQFGKLGMINTQIEVVDRNPADPFQFSLLNYQDLLPASTVQLKQSSAVKVVMADQRNLAEPAHKQQPSAPTPGRLVKGKLENGKVKAESFIDKTKAKVKDILGL